MKNNKNQKNDIFTPLDDYEKELEEYLDKGNFTSAPNLKKTKETFSQAAKKFLELQKSKSITIRINQADLIKVKAKAVDHQIPYQTLINSLIHQYAEGKTQLHL